jgi:hypothetical protein
LQEASHVVFSRNKSDSLLQQNQSGIIQTIL